MSGPWPPDGPAHGPATPPGPRAGDDVPPAAGRWAAQLAGWEIPREILDQAPRAPWVEPLGGRRQTTDSPSRQLAARAVPVGGSVLDVGCGDGRAALALAPPAAMVIGVDPRPAMLDAFADAARTRGLAHTEVLGDWPDIAGQAPFSHVVVCHQVAYDVTDLAGFALELDAHAERRVVLELSHRHPLAWLAPLWAHFWGLERPDGPTAAEAIAVLHEAGLPARLVEWQEPPQPPGTPETPWAQQVALARIRLCLTPDRDEELSWLMATQSPGPRQLVTLWWDPGQDPRQR